MLKYDHVKYAILLLLLFLISIIANNRGVTTAYIPVLAGIIVSFGLAIWNSFLLYKEAGVVVRFKDHDREIKRKLMKEISDRTRILRYAILFYLVVGLAFLVGIFFSLSKTS
jgi:uncharacterized integral membrane protein